MLSSKKKPKNTYDFAQYIPALINFFSNKFTNGSNQLYLNLFDINVIEWRILSLLAVEENIQANRVCQVMGVDKATVSRTLARMQKKNLVSIDQNSKDTRAYDLCLTEQGMTLFDQVYLISKDREQKVLEVLSPEEQQHLIQMLVKLNDHILDSNQYCLDKYLKKD